MDFGPESRNAWGGISKWGESVAVWKYQGGGALFLYSSCMHMGNYCNRMGWKAPSCLFPVP